MNEHGYPWEQVTDINTNRVWINATSFNMSSHHLDTNSSLPHMHRDCKISGHSLSSTSQLSMTVDTAIRIVWHSAEVVHFTHKNRGAFVSSTIPQYLKYSGEAPDHCLSLGDPNIGSTHWYTALVEETDHLGGHKDPLYARRGISCMKSRLSR